MELIGILKIKNDTVKVSDKFSKREFVVTIEDGKDGKYQQHISCQLSQKNCELLDSHNVGDELQVSFGLRGREWADPKGGVKYFNTIEAWRIESLSKGSSKPDSNGKLTLDTEIVDKNLDPSDLPF